MKRALNTGRRHHVKCYEPYYLAVEQRRKTAEIRLDDRDFQTGDILEMRKTDKNGNYIYEDMSVALYLDITHVLKGAPYLPEGYVMLSFQFRND